MIKHIKEDGLGAVAVNATGSNVVGTGDDTKNMTWAPQKRKLRDIIKRKALRDVNVSGK